VRNFGAGRAPLMISTSSNKNSEREEYVAQRHRPLGAGHQRQLHQRVGEGHARHQKNDDVVDRQRNQKEADNRPWTSARPSFQAREPFFKQENLGFPGRSVAACYGNAFYPHQLERIRAQNLIPPDVDLPNPSRRDRRRASAAAGQDSFLAFRTAGPCTCRFSDRGDATAQLTGILILGIGRLFQSIRRTAHATPRGRCFSSGNGHVGIL